ncbi:MAG: hypothetical protein IPH59_12870 [bacterium]|nr:hypothetical protein [bacterium]
MNESMDKNPPTDNTLPAAEPDKLLLRWESQPAKTRQRTAVIVAAFLVMLVVIVYLLTYSPLFTVAAALILWGSLSQFYLKTTFEFTEKMIRVKYLINKVEKDWSQYRTFYEDKNGVLLSPFVRSSRLENFRGIYIRFAGNREDVMKIVKSKIVMPEDPI